MSHLTARELSEVLGGEPFETDEEGWLVLIVRADGRVVALSETSVAEYYDEDAF
jgi:hypothetical protein